METAQAIKWIIATAKVDAPLVALATGGFYEGSAPIGTAMRYFLTAPQDPGTDSLGGNRKVRFMTLMLFQIKMVGFATDFDNLVSGANRIDALFRDVQSVALPDGGTMLACWRENAIAYPDPKLVDGKQVRHLGGLYQIELKGA